MIERLLLPTLAAIAAAGVASAEAPSVAADVAPVHSLVARVMQGVGEPDLVVPPGASPHGHALRPSEARSLQDADVVFWVGPELTPWLGDALASLAPDAATVALLDAPGTTVLDLREGALFEAHDHGAEDGHAPGDHEAGDREAERADAGAQGEHEHGGHDPHAWLSPENAGAWLDAIAAELSRVDPENADAYAANAAAGRDEIEALSAEIDGVLEPVRGRSFIVFHDAYQYFEAGFDFPASGAISLGDAARPSPARIERVRDRVAQAGVSCVLAEPQFDPGLVETVLDGTRARSGVLDPLGSDLAPGVGLYPRLMRNLAQTLADCL